MACLTHSCINCGHIECDNDPKNTFCVHCGAKFLTEFDEDYSEHEGREAD